MHIPIARNVHVDCLVSRNNNAVETISGRKPELSSQDGSKTFMKFRVTLPYRLATFQAIENEGTDVISFVGCASSNCDPKILSSNLCLSKNSRQSIVCIKYRRYGSIHLGRWYFACICFFSLKNNKIMTNCFFFKNSNILTFCRNYRSFFSCGFWS